MKSRGSSRGNRKHRTRSAAIRPIRWRSRQFETLEGRHLLTAPVLPPMADVTVLAGAPLHIALNGTDADGDALSYTASSSNAALSTHVPQDNRSMRISVAGHGDMVLELFEQRVPNVTGQIIDLAESGYYDGLTFHRVIKPFMIQGGDPAGDGTGGPGFAFDDEFHVDLQHTNKGALSMAKSGDDTNGSQFFITADATRHLDFNHSIFGQLTQGESVRASIARVAVGANDKPVNDVVMSSVEIFTDVQNGVLMLSAPEGASGTATVTVRASDGNREAQRKFDVTIQPDTSNAPPFLEPVADVHTLMDEPVSFSLSGIDAEGDAMLFDGIVSADTTDLEIAVSESDGQVTITPRNGLTGVHGVFVGVQAEDGNFGSNYRADVQQVPVFIEPPAATGVFLMPDSDTGPDDGDGITRLNNTPGGRMEFLVDGTAEGVLTRVLADDVVIGEAVGQADSTVVTTSGDHSLLDGEHSITAVNAAGLQEYEIGNRIGSIDVLGEETPEIAITVDASAPHITSSPGLSAEEGVAWVYDVQTDHETAGEDVGYSLAASPSGMSIDPDSGQITWTPGPGHGVFAHVEVVAADTAGNQDSQGFDIVIGELPVVDFWRLPGQVVQGEYRYTFQVARAGRLSVEVMFAHAAGNLDLTLERADGKVVNESATQEDYERVDRLARVGQMFTLVITGDNPDATIRVANLLVDGQGKLSVYGTDGDDAFLIRAGQSQQVKVNGVVYDQFHAVTDQVIEVKGRGGNDVGTIVGTEADEVATLGPGAAELTGPDHRVSMEGMPRIIVGGIGGDDRAEILDSPGDDELVVEPRKVTLSGEGFSLEALRFAKVEVNAGSGGTDTAEVHDTVGNDSFVGASRYAGLSGQGYLVQMRNFQEVQAHAQAGGNDDARFYDSPGDDTFHATPHEAILQGDGVQYQFYNRAEGFQTISAFATLGGVDTAQMFDSPGDDLFFGGPVESALLGEGFHNRAKFFEHIEARADEGGDDEARLFDSPGDDAFDARPNHAEMAGPGDEFTVTADSFDTITGFSDAGGRDQAELHGTDGHDLFSGSPLGGNLSGAGFTNYVKSFEKVSVRAGLGGVDVARLYDSPENDTLTAAPGEAELHGGNSLLKLEGFGELQAFATAGGRDVALLHDSRGDDTFSAGSKEGALYGDGFLMRVKFFEYIDAIADEGGHDAAVLYDSHNTDSFKGGPTKSTMSNGTAPVSSDRFQNRALFFEDVTAYAINGGMELAQLTDSPGNELFVAGPQYAMMIGPDYSIRVNSFFSIQGAATAGGLDVAKIFDTPGNDVFIARPEDAELTGSSLLYTAIGFDGVHVYATSGGDDQAFLYGSDGNDTLIGDPEAMALFGDGFYNRAKYFERAYAEAAEGDDDRAFLWDSDQPDLLEAEEDWARLSNDVLDFLCQAKAFDYVKATASSAGDATDLPPLSELLFTLDLDGPWQ